MCIGFLTLGDIGEHCGEDSVGSKVKSWLEPSSSVVALNWKPEPKALTKASSVATNFIVCWKGGTLLSREI